MARGSFSDEEAPFVFLVSPLPFVVAEDLPFALDVDDVDG